MKTSATAKYIGTSARKVGLVAALIRGKSVASAQQVLAFTDKRATDPVGKVLASALANAQNNYSAKKGDLVVESVLVGPAPSLKRMRPRAKGASSAILKRASHITIVLTDNKSEAKPAIKAVTKPSTNQAEPAAKAKATATKADSEKK